ncbi:hypothetical protein V6N12_035321 [Hibiscus sabdariffa]|uniref:Uncharacterized protein n=1 Tax=Hibiscus sabdariffa TaxID=183260 RepID=A0ABR2BS94_9ROSI
MDKGNSGGDWKHGFMAENELWERLRVVFGSTGSRCAVAPVETTPILLNVEQPANWVSVLIADGVELQNRHVVEGSTTEILIRNGSTAIPRASTATAPMSYVSQLFLVTFC